eukprot:20911_1
MANNLYEAQTPIGNVKLYHFRKNGMKNVRPDTNDASGTEMIGDTEQLDTPTNMCTDTDMYVNGSKSHDVNMKINESKLHKSQHGMLNDSVSVTEGNDRESTTNNTFLTETVNISRIKG